MPTHQRSLTKARLFLGIVFLLSATIFLVMSYLTRTPPGNQPSQPPDQGILLVEYLSLLSSAVSLIALIPTTIISWRRENRASTQAELDMKQREIQLAQDRLALERERFELEQLRASLDQLRDRGIEGGS
jgi:hypothetical protein